MHTLPPVQSDLDVLETQIFNYEETYLTESPHGNVVRGWGPRPPDASEVKESERLFSNSSVTARKRKNQMKADESGSGGRKQPRKYRKHSDGEKEARAGGAAEAGS
jgi:hypothetical protein